MFTLKASAVSGPIDMVFAVSKLQGRRILLVSMSRFVDLAKAFDTVNKDGLYRVHEKIGCLSKLLKIVQSFHDGMEAHVSFDGGT